MAESFLAQFFLSLPRLHKILKIQKNFSYSFFVLIEWFKVQIFQEPFKKFFLWKVDELRNKKSKPNKNREFWNKNFKKIRCFERIKFFYINLVKENLAEYFEVAWFGGKEEIFLVIFSRIETVSSLNSKRDFSGLYKKRNHSYSFGLDFW